MKRALTFLVLFLGGAVLAQESASFKLTEHAFNAGGSPKDGVVLTSTSFQVTLSALGDTAAATASTSASFQLDGGFTTGYPPPGEVLLLLMNADAQTLVWSPEGSVGSYNLYRDFLSNLSGLGYGSCEQQNLTDMMTTDTDSLAIGEGYFYLVTAENRLSEEGTKGFDSDLTERMGLTCP